MFLSPCHFGCTNQTTSINNNINSYSSCGCAENITVSESACQFRRIPCKIFYYLKKLMYMFSIVFIGLVSIVL